MISYRWSQRAGGMAEGLKLWVILAGDIVLHALRERASVRRHLSGAGILPSLELRRAVRSLRRAPGFVVAVVGIVAVTVAVNLSVFAFVRGTLLSPPPYPDPDRVVIAWGSNPTRGQVRDVVSGPNYLDLSERARSLTGLAAVHGDEVLWSRQQDREVVPALEVSVGFLGVLGVTPTLGRNFEPRDGREGSAPTVLVSFDFWRDRLAADPSVIGSTLSLDGLPTAVVGVLPEDFRFVAPASVIVPLKRDILAAQSRTNHHYHLIGRLTPEASPQQATRELSAVMTELAGEYPVLEGWSVLVEPLYEVTVEAVEGPLWLLTVAVLGLSAVAILNLTSLFRVRATGHRAELAFQKALGAPLSNLATGAIAEALGLTVAGAAIGAACTPWLLSRLAVMAPPTITIPGSAAAVPALRTSLDASLVIIVALVAVAAGLVLALPSVIQSTRTRATTCAPAGTRVRGHSRAPWILGVEFALTTALCVGAALTVRSASNLLSRDVGMDPDGLVTVYFGDLGDLPDSARTGYFRQVLQSVEQLPGVSRVGLNDYVPFQGEDDFQGMRFPDRPPPLPGEGPREEWRRVSEGLFEAAGMRMVRGRGFEPGDFETTPGAVVVNEAFVAKYYPDEDPVGASLTVTERGYTDVVIVGVVGDVLMRGPALPAPPVLYAPFQGAPRDHMALFARVTGGAAPQAAAIREAIVAVDPSQPVLPAAHMSDIVAQATAVPRMTRNLVTGVALIALLLAAAGMFALVGYTVRTRRGEFGVRLALGATKGRIESELVRMILPLLAVAVPAGLALALLASRLLSRLLYGVSGADPWSLVGATIAVAGVAVFAGWLPARTVASIDPAQALRDS